MKFSQNIDKLKTFVLCPSKSDDPDCFLVLQKLHIYWLYQNKLMLHFWFHSQISSSGYMERKGGKNFLVTVAKYIIHGRRWQDFLM